MAVRLQMKLGVVAETDRLPDSPDAVVVVEPSVGSVARSKGNLYLLVTARTTGNKVRDAARVVAETIRNEYYYDESAGIRVCIEKAIRSANKRMAHQGDRFAFGHHPEGNGPIGVALAVVRGNELYVATVGPADAFLIRQARLSTLPDPHRERGLPAGELEPDVWRGEISVGDSLLLVSANVVAKLAPDELKDAMVTLHPQSAMEHLHHRFIAADGSGSDGAIAFEATEVSSTTRQRTLVPVRPPEPLAGAPDRSPIPLADQVEGGVAAVTAGAQRARTAAGGAFGRVVRRLQDMLPHRQMPHRRVTTASSRVETQRRAAVAALAFIAIAVVLGVSVWVLGAGNPSQSRLASLNVADAALKTARDDVGKVFGPGIDLVRDDVHRAQDLLSDAYRQLQIAASAGVPAATLDPLRAQVSVGLDRIFKVVPVGPTTVFSFAAAKPAVDLTALIRGYDGAPYVLDRANKTVYRIDVPAKKATPVLRAGQRADGAVAAEPRLMAVGGRDLLILDARNTLWRWNSADAHGRGTLNRVHVTGATSWGTDVRAIATFGRGGGLYNLYVLDPSEKQLEVYTPALDGSGFPAPPTGRLATAQTVDDVDVVLIDGDIYFSEAGALKRVAGADWKPADPGDELLRTAPHSTYLASFDERGKGALYAYDRPNARVVAYSKDTGDVLQQYRLANGDKDWADVRGMFVVPGAAGAPPTIFWIDGTQLASASLQAVPETIPGASASPPPSVSPSAAAPSPTKRPKATPRPTRKP